jgi:hypothetical protein
MALVLLDRVQQTGTANTTVSFTLTGSVTGYQSFSVIGNGNTTYYAATDVSGNWEVGIGTYATGGTLTRTTILSSSNSGSAVTFSGTVNVFVTYPSERSVNLDGSNNVSALGTITSGVWNGTTIPVAYGGTGVTASSGANSVVLRDANQNITFNNYTANANVVTAAAGTTVLTVASARTQILTGSTTQTFQLPNATTLALGQSFIFVNNSSGVLTVTNNSGATVETVPSGGITQLGALSIATSAGSWGAYSFIPAAVDWGTNALNLASTVISGGTWQGGTIQPAYGGTGLTTFTAANNALYSSGSTTLTAGTLPVPAGGTGQTSFTSGYIPYGNTTAALQSSSLLQFNGTYLQVGGGSVLGGATNPIAAFSQSANNYVQTYTYNSNTGISTSADYVAYTDNSTDAHGWADMGFTGSNYADTVYTVTGPNEAYLFGSAPSGASKTGNLVYATDNTGTANAHQWYVGGFTQAKSAYKMQLGANYLELKTPIYVTGSTGTSGQVLTSAGSGAAPTWVTPTTGGGTITVTDFTATAGQTVFTVSYTVGLLEVYRNGIKLGQSDFTATNGTSFTLATGANAGDLVEAVVFSSLNIYSTITYQDFSGDGTTTIFTMNSVPANAASLLVAINGVVQDPGTYTVASTTLTFTTAPPAGTNNVSVRYLGVQSVSTVSSFSAGTTGLTPSSATTGGVVLAGTLNTTNGGTGLTSFTSGGAVYATSTSALTTGTLPVASGGTGITSFGTGVATALGTNVGSAGAFVTNGGALGTPTSGTLTNCTFPTLNQNTTGTSGGISVSGGWAVTPSGTKLNFIYNGVTVASLDSSGNFIAKANVTAYGTP